MDRSWRVLVRPLTIAAGTGVLLVVGSHLWAQTSVSPPASGSGEIGLLAEGSTRGEVFPHFFRGPKGEVLRLWQAEGDPKAGGAGVLLALAKPQDAWEKLLEIRPKDKGVNAREGSLAVRPPEELAVVYRWWRNVPRSKQLRVARSNDGGKTWDQSSVSVDTSGKAFSPRIAWSDKSLVVVWADERRGDQLFDIYARRSPDGGRTWEPEKVLSRFQDQRPSDIAARPLLVSDGKDRLWAAYAGFRTTHSSIYLSRSVDGGRTWTDPVSLTGAASRSVFGHSLLRVGDRMMLVWQDARTGRDRLYAISSSDNGVTWTDLVRVDHLPDSSPAGTSSPTAVLMPDGEALVAWQDGRNGRDDIFLARSLDWGRSWGKEDVRMDADEPGTAISRFAKLANASDGRVAIVWEDDRSGEEQIYLRIRSAGNQGVWSPETRVTTPALKRASHLPELIWGPDGMLHLAWQVWDMSMAPTRIVKQIAGSALKPDGPEK
jgi:hypothetical protein